MIQKKKNFGYLGDVKSAVAPVVTAYSSLEQRTPSTVQSAVATGSTAENYLKLLNGQSVSEGNATPPAASVTGGEGGTGLNSGTSVSGLAQDRYAGTGFEPVSNVILASADGGGSGSGSSGDGSGSGSSGGTSGSTKGKSVEEIYSELYNYYDERYKKEEENAGQYKQDAIDTAEKDFQKDMAESQAALTRNLDRSGAVGEQLARMGLTGSGYSDYLTGKAMELQRTEAMNASLKRSNAISDANKAYRDLLISADATRDEQKLAILGQEFADAKENEANRSTLLGNMLDLAMTGEVDIALMKALAIEKGVEFSEGTWDVLGTAVSRAKTNKEREFIAALFNGDNPLIDNYDPKNAEDVKKLGLLADAYGIDKSGEVWNSVVKALGGVELENNPNPEPEDGGQKWDEITVKSTKNRDAYYDVDSNKLADMGQMYDFIRNQAGGAKIYSEQDALNAAKKLASNDKINVDGGYLFYSNDSSKIKTSGYTWTGDGADFNITINGQTYGLEFGWHIGDYIWTEGGNSGLGMKAVLNQLVGGAPKEGDAAVMNGDLFVYANGEWRTTSNRFGDGGDTYKNAVNAYIAASKSGTPEDGSGENSSEDSTLGGGGNNTTNGGAAGDPTRTFTEVGILNGFTLGEQYNMEDVNSEYENLFTALGSMGEITPDDLTGGNNPLEKTIRNQVIDAFEGAGVLTKNFDAGTIDINDNTPFAPLFKENGILKAAYDVAAKEYKDFVKGSGSDDGGGGGGATNTGTTNKYVSDITQLEVSQDRNAWANDGHKDDAEQRAEAYMDSKDSDKKSKYTAYATETGTGNKGIYVSELRGIGDGHDLVLSVNGKKYNLEVNKEAGEKTQSVLNEIAPNAKNRSTAVFGGDLYVKYDGKWYSTSSQNWFSGSDYKEAVDAYKYAVAKDKADANSGNSGTGITKVDLSATQERSNWSNNQWARDDIAFRVKKGVELVNAGKAEKAELFYSEKANATGNAGWKISNLNSFKDGSGFEIRINGTTYELEVGFKIEDTDAINQLNSIAGDNAAVFACGDLLVKDSEDNWYATGSRSNDTKPYTGAVDAFEGLKDKKQVTLTGTDGLKTQGSYDKNTQTAKITLGGKKYEITRSEGSVAYILGNGNSGDVKAAKDQNGDMSLFYCDGTNWIKLDAGEESEALNAYFTDYVINTGKAPLGEEKYLIKTPQSRTENSDVSMQLQRLKAVNNIINSDFVDEVAAKGYKTGICTLNAYSNTSGGVITANINGETYNLNTGKPVTDEAATILSTIRTINSESKSNLLYAYGDLYLNANGVWYTVYASDGETYKDAAKAYKTALEARKDTSKGTSLPATAASAKTNNPYIDLITGVSTGNKKPNNVDYNKLFNA